MVMFLTLFGTQVGNRDAISWAPSETPVEISSQVASERVTRR